LANAFDETYSAEELVAELGSAFMMAEFGFDSEQRDSAYIAHWIKFLTDHDHAIVSAASMASKAVEFLRNKVAAEPMQQAA
jgi:antirestriction protein ArdC